MATRIRLRRVGRRKQPEFRIVVAHKTDARDGAFVDAIGHYNPRTTPETLSVDVAKAREWLGRGATPSYTVRSLFKRAGVFAASADAAPESPASAPPPPSEG
jgi:small subunit ribosomal protein S16